MSDVPQGAMEPSACIELASFFNMSGDLLAVIDDSLRLLHFNPAWATTLGHSPIRGRSILESVAPRDWEKVRRTFSSSLASGASCSFDAALLRRTQQLRHAQWKASCDPHEGRIYLVVRDVTVRQRLEQELVSAHRLEAIGQLAAGIAHEINTPIQFVGDNLAFLGESLSGMGPLMAMLLELRHRGECPDASSWSRVLRAIDDADLEFVEKEAPKAVESASEGVHRVAELVRGMKEFAHPDSLAMAPADINRAIECTLKVSRNEWKYVANVETELNQLPEVVCQVAALNQVFLNLVCNAAQAIEDKAGVKKGDAVTEKGTIRISTREEGNHVVVSVTDTGVGIPEHIKHRVFEPFFTTKAVGRGSGQGLAISRAIVVERHHGELNFESKEGVGTTFHVRLPVSHEARDHEG